MRNIINLLFFLSSSIAFAQPASKPYPFNRPLYLGFVGGYGSTTWEGLVPSIEKQNMALSISTPRTVDEGGGVWGFMAGFEFMPYLALEATYMRYPDAKIYFEEDSLFTFENEGTLGFTTKTETASIMAKIMLIIPGTTLRAFSSAGGAIVQRTDIMSHDWRLTPTFGLGLNATATEHIMGEIGFNYTAGYGESELNPAQDYVPFLFSINARLAYRF